MKAETSLRSGQGQNSGYRGDKKGIATSGKSRLGSRCYEAAVHIAVVWAALVCELSRYEEIIMSSCCRL